MLSIICEAAVLGTPLIILLPAYYYSVASHHTVSALTSPKLSSRRKGMADIVITPQSYFILTVVIHPVQNKIHIIPEVRLHRRVFGQNRTVHCLLIVARISQNARTN